MSQDSLEVSEKSTENTACCDSKQPLPKSFEEFVSQLSQLPLSEEKLQMAIQYMEMSLSQNGCPNFKNFWESRKLCGEIFKENIPAQVRSALWPRYRDLSKEARNLKEMLDEQSAFAVEQIEIAIQALETEVGQIGSVTDNAPIVFDQLVTIEKNFPFYQQTQKELNFLNTLASRINALRKELIKTEMRIKFKNKFFQRLSAAGDKVFPRRKDLIKELSQTFIGDIEKFIETYFSSEGSLQDALFLIREEIKGLQGLAKQLTLNTQAFNETRLKLSECWDKIKQMEKERKKERMEMRSIFRQNAEEVKLKITALVASIETENYTSEQIFSAVNEISQLMRDVELGKDEIKELRFELNEIKKIATKKVQTEEEDKKYREGEKDRKRLELIDEMKVKIEKFLSKVHEYDVESVLSERDDLFKQIQGMLISKFERQNFEKMLKPVKDIVAEKREQVLENLSDDEKQVLLNLKEILKERKERSREIKEQIEIYRKVKGTSISDFEQAMSYNEQLLSERERLEKVNIGIAEIQQKIDLLEEKLR